jgi:hypothetical protein
MCPDSRVAGCSEQQDNSIIRTRAEEKKKGIEVFGRAMAK